VFCNQKTISGQKTAAVEGAKEQINKWRAWVKPSVENEAAFYGGSFTGLDISLQKELLALTDELLANKVIGSVRLSTRPDYIDEERLELLRAHGVKLVELGVQSLDDAVLAVAERGHTAEQVSKAVALLKQYGFKVGLQLMVGMPKQDFSSVKATVKYPLVNWSVDTLDWKNRISSSVVSSIKGSVRDGSIVLMHDLYGSTANATKIIVPWLVDEGYQLVTVTQLMQLKGIYMEPGKLYYSAN
jgi:radical SAM superfamily enzyme